MPIFKYYSTREITKLLNERVCLSPRGDSWSFTSLYGHKARGTGVFNNELYIGGEIWNRSKWIKDPTTGKRKRIQRPESEWVIQDKPNLRIVSDELWLKVKNRQQDVSQKNRKNQETGNHLGSGGRAAKYLLSGFLKCSDCGANYTLVN